MYGIHDKVYNDLLKYFNDNSNIYKVILFGSRAKGNAKYNSDIDLAIDCDKKYKGTIYEDIDELIGVYSCDIAFLDRINNELKDQIDKYGITIYEKI